MKCKSNKPKWIYDFDCRQCESLKAIIDPTKKRDGVYCIPVINAVDRRPPGWTLFNPDGTLKPDDTGTIHADEHDRHLRCDSFVPRKDTNGKHTDL